jgi:hypothetical protein
MRKLVSSVSWSGDESHLWCRAEITALVGDSTGLHEDQVFEKLCRNYNGDQKDWLKLTPGRRAIIVSDSIGLMLFDGSLETVPGTIQATGRRCLRAVNALDRIVRSIESSET